MSGDSIGQRLEREWDHDKHAVADWFRRETPAAPGVNPYDPQAPAAAPVTLAAAPAPPEGETVSIATDAETWYAEAKAKFAEAEQHLPAIFADAKKLEGNPIAQVAIQAGEHVLAGVLPPEALTFLEGGVKNDLERLLGLYSPSGSPAPAAQEVPAA